MFCRSLIFLSTFLLCSASTPVPFSFTTAIVLGRCVPGVYDRAQVCYMDPGGSGGMVGQAYYSVEIDTDLGFTPGMYNVQSCLRYVDATASLYPALAMYAYPAVTTTVTTVPTMATGPYVLNNLTSFTDVFFATGTANYRRTSPAVYYHPADTVPSCATQQVFLSAIDFGSVIAIPVQVQWQEFQAYTTATRVIHTFSVTPPY